MNIEEYNFNIPEHLIAQKPADRRSDSRLLIYHRNEDRIEDSLTGNLSNFIDSNFHLVFNNSRVLPGRFRIIKKENNRDGEILVLKVLSLNEVEVITDKSKKYRKGTVIELPGNIEGVISEEIDQLRKIIHVEENLFTNSYFESYGMIPIPPYIKKGQSDKFDNERYQTVYSKNYGSSAAPTAGLHFDDSIFESLNKKDIGYSFVTLNVGLGTFQPIYVDNIEDHKIHTEEYSVSEEEASKINEAIKNKKKILAVGTTSLRTLESSFKNGYIESGFGSTDLYIYPPYNFKVVDSLFTNFHTPKSSLLVLVSSLIGREKLFEIYDYAIKKEYRFFSYGDAMLIL